MPTATTGQKLKNIDRISNFLRVTGEGQKVLLRFASNDYAYEGKHISEYNDANGEKKYKVENCPKINEDLECEKCDTYYEMIKPTYELRAKRKASTDEKEQVDLDAQIKKIRDKARPFQAKVTFYYPVLKRPTSFGEQPQAMIFQTSMMVRNKLEESQTLGYDITEFDFTVLCTKKLPNYYIVDRIDSSRTKGLDDKEEALLKEAKGFDLGKIIKGGKVHEEPEKEEEDDESVEQSSEASTPEVTEGSEIPF